MQVGLRSGNSTSRPGSGAKPFHIADSSNQQLVPYAKGKNSGHIGNISAAMAYAFQNGGKISKTDGSGNIQVLSFLQEIGKRSLDKGSIEIRSSFGRTGSNSHVITFSQFHINEISKGVVKLNQILRGCSNGTSFDRYSKEVGNQLLKGAMDLEQSLRTLVNLQEASDWMIKPRGKNKIKLLDDDEDDENEKANLTDLKQIERPRFSFDKPNKNPRRGKQARKTMINEQPLALTYPKETQRIQENESSSSHPQPQKQRASNVIAKLMGLEEPPPKGNSKVTRKVLNPIEAMASKKDANFSDFQPQHTKSKPDFNRSKDEIRHQKINPTRTSAGQEANISTIAVGKQQNIQLIEEPKYRIVFQETGSEDNDSKDKEKIKQKGKVENRLLEEEMRNKVPRKLGASEADHTKKTLGSLTQIRQEKLMDNHYLQQQQQQRIVRKPDATEWKRKLQHPKQKLLIREPKGRQEEKIAISKPKSSPRVPEKKQAIKKSAMKQPETKGSSIPSNRRHGLDTADMKISKQRIDRKIDEVVNTRNIVLSQSTSLQKPQSEVCQKMEQEHDKKTRISVSVKEGSNRGIQEQSITVSSKPDAISHSSCETALSQEAEVVTCYNSCEEKDQSLDLSQFPTANHTSIDIAEETPEIKQDRQLRQQPSDYADDLHTESPKASSPPHGDHEVKADIQNTAQNELGKNCESCVLTKPEKHLKEILIKGQLFLNKAEALFKLNIPLGILQVPDPDDQNVDTRLSLDCAKELLKKKEKRQGLGRYQFKDTSFECVMFKSFDEMIKQLNRDFCKLRSYGGKWSEECDIAEYLYEMLEKDIHNKDPDINCMWDLGWYEKMFAVSVKDELIKNLEKHMLNGLLDEVTRDLLHA